MTTFHDMLTFIYVYIYTVLTEPSYICTEFVSFRPCMEAGCQVGIGRISNHSGPFCEDYIKRKGGQLASGLPKERGRWGHIIYIVQGSTLQTAVALLQQGTLNIEQQSTTVAAGPPCGADAGVSSLRLHGGGNPPPSDSWGPGREVVLTHLRVYLLSTVGLLLHGTGGNTLRRELASSVSHRRSPSRGRPSAAVLAVSVRGHVPETWRLRPTCTSSSPTTPQLRGGYQLQRA